MKQSKDSLNAIEVLTEDIKRKIGDLDKSVFERLQETLKAAQDKSNGIQVNPVTLSQWEGKWRSTSVIIGGTHVGQMELAIANNNGGQEVEGWYENPQGGKSVIRNGHLSGNNKKCVGEWQNPVLGKSGTFSFELVTPNLFIGNYAMEGNPIIPTKNHWQGIKP